MAVRFRVRATGRVGVRVVLGAVSLNIRCALDMAHTMNHINGGASVFLVLLLSIR